MADKTFWQKEKVMKKQKTHISLRNTILFIASFFLSSPIFAAPFTIDFDSLPGNISPNQNLSFFDANNGANSLNGVTFTSSAFRVIGDDYRVGGPDPNPTFGIPHSGQYFINNNGEDNVILNTNFILTSAWFGRNEYYGYGGGASSVTVTAFGLTGDLGFVTIDLPDSFPGTGNLPPPNNLIGDGLADPMMFMDTSSFLSLSGIIGYRISRVATAAQTGDWVGDDFSFTTVTFIPLPGSLALIGSVLGIWYGLSILIKQSKK